MLKFNIVREDRTTTNNFAFAVASLCGLYDCPYIYRRVKCLVEEREMLKIKIVSRCASFHDIYIRVEGKPKTAFDVLLTVFLY
jgi:hypothetical protein